MPLSAPFRRRLLGSGLGAALLGRAGVARADDDAGAEWLAFQRRFMAADGRVVDTGNNGVSHTEGQGWGLLFAEYFDDRPAFERVLAWTSANLARPDDALHAWRYVPGAAEPVADTNNATDGDLFIAWALARAARRWSDAAHERAGFAIAADVLRLLVRRVAGETVLLPGAVGFEKPGQVVVNPSYTVFPALAALARLVPSPHWAALRQSGLRLIERGRFGRWMLPPDWLAIDRRSASLSPAVQWPPRCSFDAVRVPLYLGWGDVAAPAVTAAFARFYAPRDGAPAPAWVDLETGAVAPYAASPGLLAAATPAADLPRVADAADYYSAALTLLARIARRERRRG